MMTAMKAAGLQVMVDIVPNHSSNEHSWFQEALQSPKGSEARARFHFHDGECCRIRAIPPRPRPTDSRQGIRPIETTK